MDKERKKLTWALGLVAGLGILSIVYAALSSTLYIKGEGNVVTGQVKFTECKPVAIGTNDLTVNSAAGAQLSGDYSGAYSGDYKFIDYTYNGDTGSIADAALAFGKAATDISITRSDYRSNHDGDTLTINGTELYDYGTAVIYEAKLENTAKNPMYLSQAPVVVAKFTPSRTGATAQIDNSVAVSVHPTLAEAKAYDAQNVSTGLLQPFDLEDNTSTAVSSTNSTSNYLNAKPDSTSTINQCSWFIKIRKVVQDNSQGEDSANYASGNEGYLESGSFSFTVNLADSSTYGDDTMKPAVWETSGKSNSNS